MPGINETQQTQDPNNNCSTNTTDKHENFIRVWCDGCYDVVHFGHANNLRQAKKLGDYLMVGVHSDEEIQKHKGPTVFTEKERYIMVKAVKWVDEVVRDVPYVTTVHTLDKYKIDFCAHGDDITTTADGIDTYQEVKDAGRYREVQRTQGISTTKLVQRILSLSSTKETGNKANEYIYSPWTGSNFLPTTRKILEFSEGKQIPNKNSRIVYVDGAFDIFHPGHIAFLEAASKLGDYVLVGVHNDEVVVKYKSGGYPIMSVHERYFTILGCKYVNDVVIGAPYTVTKELLEHFNVAVVAYGDTTIENDPDTGKDPYALAKEMKICKKIFSGSNLTTEKIVARVLVKQNLFEERNRAKENKERAIFEDSNKALIISSQADRNALDMKISNK